MIGPITAALAQTPAAKSLPYCLRMVGISADPSAEASAMAEPDTPENTMAETMLTWASPPRTPPTRTSAKRRRRPRMPEVPISSPASMKNGTAISTKLSTPVNMRCGMRIERDLAPDEHRGERGEAEAEGDRHPDQERHGECQPMTPSMAQLRTAIAASFSMSWGGGSGSRIMSAPISMMVRSEPAGIAR